MTEKVIRTGIIKETGYIYFVEKDGHIWRNSSEAGSLNREKAEMVVESGLIRDEGYIEDLVHRIDRLETLIQELTGKSISQEAISPITKIDSEMDATPLETHLGAAEGVDSGGHGESSDLSESNAEIQSVDSLPEQSGEQGRQLSLIHI